MATERTDAVEELRREIGMLNAKLDRLDGKSNGRHEAVWSAVRKLRGRTDRLERAAAELRELVDAMNEEGSETQMRVDSLESGDHAQDISDRLASLEEWRKVHSHDAIDSAIQNLSLNHSTRLDACQGRIDSHALRLNANDRAISAVLNATPGARIPDEALAEKTGVYDRGVARARADGVTLGEAIGANAKDDEALAEKTGVSWQAAAAKDYGRAIALLARWVENEAVKEVAPQWLVNETRTFLTAYLDKAMS